MNVASLKTLISLAEPFLLDQDFIPILQHFCFKPHSITAYNDAQAIVLECKTDLCCAVPGKLFSKLLGTITSDEIELVLNPDKTNLLIGSGRNKAKLPVLSPKEFVFEMPDVEGIEVVLNEQVKQGFYNCLSTVGQNPTQPERNGITIKVEREVVHLYTTDGVSISTFKIPGLFAISELEQMWAIMPTFFCNQLYSLMKTLKLAPRLIFDESCVLAYLESHRVFSRVINAEPPKFDAAIEHFVPKPLDEIELHKIPDGLVQALTRATLMLQPEKNVKTTTITLETDGLLKLHTISEKGIAQDEIETPFKMAGTQPIKLISDPHYLLRGCNLCDYMTMHEKVFIFGESDRNFYHLVSTKSATE